MQMEEETIKSEIQRILEAMGFSDEVEAIESRHGTTNRFEVLLRGRAMPPRDDGEGEDESNRSSASMLIGEQGRNLIALEHILKKIIKKKYGEETKFTLDINDYRVKRLEGLKQDVKNAAKEVRMYHRQVVLRPMSAFERRVVHLLLAEYPDIATESMGEEPNRRVIIKPYP